MVLILIFMFLIILNIILQSLVLEGGCFPFTHFDFCGWTNNKMDTRQIIR